VTCEDRNLELNALLDDELPAAELAALTAHLATCPVCLRRLAELGAVRAALAEAVPEEAIAPAFAARINAMLAAEAARAAPARVRIWPARVAIFALGAALAAAVALTLAPNPNQRGELMAVRDAALRSGGVGIAAEAPRVPGFALAAAREDWVAGHRSQVATYRRAGQDVTLCIWLANGEPAHGLRVAHYRDATIEYWNDGVHEYWATGPTALVDGFVVAIRA